VPSYVTYVKGKYLVSNMQAVQKQCGITFMFMTDWVFEVRHCPTLPNEIKKTKLQIYTSPQAGINILLAAVASPHSVFRINSPSKIMILESVKSNGIK
jgi:hypothetical protein